jgi:hypothetical protein
VVTLVVGISHRDLGRRELASYYANTLRRRRYPASQRVLVRGRFDSQRDRFAAIPLHGIRHVTAPVGPWCSTGQGTRRR